MLEVSPDRKAWDDRHDSSTGGATPTLDEIAVFGGCRASGARCHGSFPNPSGLG
jgi:hypothetical protein